MLKKTVFSLLVLLAYAAPSFAQPSLPICKRPVELGELILAVRTNDQKLLNADCMKFVEAFNATFKLPADEQPKNCEQLAQLFERLHVTKAPAGMEANFTRILRNGKVDLYGFSRQVRLEEEWGFDPQFGIWIMSMYCCNLISKSELPVPREDVTVRPEGSPVPPPAAAPIAKAVKKAAAKVKPERVRPAESNGPNFFSLKRKTGKFFLTTAIMGAAVAGYCMANPDKCIVAKATAAATANSR